jgi:hypothetical protein
VSVRLVRGYQIPFFFASFFAPVAPSRLSLSQKSLQAAKKRMDCVTEGTEEKSEK